MSCCKAESGVKRRSTCSPRRMTISEMLSKAFSKRSVVGVAVSRLAQGTSPQRSLFDLEVEPHG